MAKFESEGYCPCNWVPQKWNETTDSRIIGLWDLIGSSIVYERNENFRHCEPDCTTCDEIFGVDPISFDLLKAIVKRNVNADKILVHQHHNGGCNTQKLSDVQVIMAESKDPQIVASAGSNFIVVLASAEHGLDLWVWDLRSCR